MPLTNAPFHDEWHEVADTGQNMVLWAAPDLGKTSQFCVIRVLHALGRDPRKRFAILSATENLGTKVIAALKGHIEKNRVVHDVFPHLRRGSSWAASSFTVERPHGIKDPSVEAFGVGAGSLSGARLDGLFVDDALTPENTRTKHMRDQVDTWIRAAAFSRLQSGAQICFLANALHPEDMAHRLAKQPGWWSGKYPVLGEDGEPTWPEQWPMERIAHARDELFGPHEFRRMCMCEPYDESSARFKKEWLEACLANGEGWTLTYALTGVPPGIRVFTGVDLGISQQKGSDLTVLFTIAVHDDESRQVLEIQAGRYTGPEIVERIIDVHRRLHSIVYVENVAAQDYILQFAKKVSSVPVRPLPTTAARKWNVQFGVESLAVEMANAKWIIPCAKGTRRAHPEIEAWLGEMLYYDPLGHTGDRLMASWFAREGARESRPKIQVGRLDTLRR